MSAKGYLGLAAAGLLAAMLTACGSGGGGEADESDASLFDDLGFGDFAKVPTRYGLYASQDGKLGRLDGEKSFQVETWDNRSGLQPDVTFVAFDRALGDRATRLSDAIQMRRVVRVRNEVSAAGQVTPLQKDTWVVADLPEYVVPLDFEPISGSPEMMRIIPARPLAPGLYALQLRTGTSSVAGRFGVEWPKVDKAQYASQACVDRYAGQSTTYRACADLETQLSQQVTPKATLKSAPLQPLPPPNTLQHQLVQPYQTPPQHYYPDPPAPQQQAAQPPQQPPQPAPMPSPQGLQLRDVQAARTSDQGVAILTVEGVVVNTANAARRVPPLQATVRDLQGKELDRWTFNTEISELPPGGSTGFRTETIYPTTTSTNVAVTFATDSTAQAQ